MKWTPKTFNDTLAIIIVLSFLLFIAWCFHRGFTGEVVVLVIGQLTAILLLVGQHYYRKAKNEADTTDPTVRHG